MKKNMLKKAVLLGLVAVFASGCASNNDDIHRWMSEVKNRPSPPLPAIPDVPEYDQFIYQQDGLRDPFVNTVAQQQKAEEEANSMVEVADGPRPDPNRPREPLEAFSLASLRMVGTIGSGENMAGLVRDPNGVTHRVLLGHRLGNKEGRIIAVEGVRIRLIELNSNGQGGWEEVETSISLN